MKNDNGDGRVIFKNGITGRFVGDMCISISCHALMGRPDAVYMEAQHHI